MNQWINNWMAFCAQFRRVSGKALVLSGTQGTGKGLLYNRVLRPLFDVHAPRTTLARFEKDFNGFMGLGIFVFVDEVDKSAQRHGDASIMQNLKQYITDPTLVVEKKYHEATIVQNHCNFILASNQFDVLGIADEDRRFVVAPRQEKPILPTLEEKFGLAVGAPLEAAIAAELPAYASHLMHVQVDESQAQTLLDTLERNRLIEQGNTKAQSMAKIFRAGDLTKLLEIIREEWPHGISLATPGIRFVDRTYVQLGTECIEHARAGKKMNIARDEIHGFFIKLMPKTDASPSNFSRELNSKHGLHVINVKVKGSTVKGIQGVCWVVDPKEAEAYEKWVESLKNVVPAESHFSKKPRRDI